MAFCPSLLQNFRVETIGDLTLFFVRHRKTERDSCTVTVLVDTEDVERILAAGYIQIREQSNGYYANIQARGQAIPLQRFLMHPLPEEVVDHEYGNTLDNRKRHLHCVTPQANRANQNIARSNNRSGRLGVKEVGHKWAATFTHLGLEYNFGYFSNPDRAAEAYYVGREKVRCGEIDHTSIWAAGGKRRFAWDCDQGLRQRIKALTIFDPIPDGLRPYPVDTATAKKAVPARAVKKPLARRLAAS